MDILKKERSGSGAIIVICIFALILLRFMGAIFISNIILFVTIVPFTLIEIIKPQKFTNVLIVVFAGVFLSMVSSLAYRGQSFFESFKACSYIFFILFYFFLTNNNYSLKTVEKSVFILGLIACILYIVQSYLSKKGIVIIETAESSLDGQIGIERFRMIGGGLISLNYFLCLNKILTKKGTLITYVCATFCLMAIVLMGFRTMMAGILLFSFILSFQILGIKKIWKFVILLTILFIVLINIPSIKNMLTYTIERQQEGTETFSNPDYIRWKSLDYYLNNHFHNGMEMFFGSGLPFLNKGAYGQYHERLRDVGIYYQDCGLLGLSWMIGIIPVFFMCCYSIIAYRMKIEPQYKYIGIWYLYLLAISTVTMEFYREGNFVVQALALYLVAKANTEYQWNEDESGDNNENNE